MFGRKRLFSEEDPTIRMLLLRSHTCTGTTYRRIQIQSENTIHYIGRSVPYAKGGLYYFRLQLCMLLLKAPCRNCTCGTVRSLLRIVFAWESYFSPLRLFSKVALLFCRILPVETQRDYTIDPGRFVLVREEV